MYEPVEGGLRVQQFTCWILVFALLLLTFGKPVDLKGRGCRASLSHGHGESGFETVFQSGFMPITCVVFTWASRLLWLMISYLWSMTSFVYRLSSVKLSHIL